jgi:hypothetical protein
VNLRVNSTPSSTHVGINGVQPSTNNTSLTDTVPNSNPYPTTQTRKAGGSIFIVILLIFGAVFGGSHLRRRRN